MTDTKVISRRLHCPNPSVDRRIDYVIYYKWMEREAETLMQSRTAFSRCLVVDLAAEVARRVLHGSCFPLPWNMVEGIPAETLFLAILGDVDGGPSSGQPGIVSTTNHASTGSPQMAVNPYDAATYPRQNGFIPAPFAPIPSPAPIYTDGRAAAEIEAQSTTLHDLVKIRLSARSTSSKTHCSVC